MPNDGRSAAGVLWTPPSSLAENSRLAQFTDWLRETKQRDFETYDDLWVWSSTAIGEFWEAVWQFFDVQGHSPYSVALGDARMPGAEWFPGSTVNYAEHALRHDLTTPAIVTLAESREPVELSWADLRGQVGAVAQWLTDHGVGKGDRVVGYLPNISAAVVTFLACASIGAIWSSCSQEYSSQGAADRFEQLEPVVLVASDGYMYGGKEHSRRQEVEGLRELLPTVRETLWIDYISEPDDALSGAHRFADVIATPASPTYLPVEFSHPLWILYSSGTTGRPKGIVHGHGGITLEHLKNLGLHMDLKPGSRFFWFSTTSWMMWNVQVSGLLHGATIVLYDGNPAWPDQGALWKIAADNGINLLGTSAAYLLASQKHGIQPGKDYDLGRMTALGSTGSPLPSSCAKWVYESLPDVWLSPASGGTDIASGFCGGVPTIPLRAEEMQGRLLGVALESWDPDGNPLTDEVGELVVTKPMPSMPLYFWNDESGSRYRDAYFDRFPGVWRHGDWVTVTSHGGVTVHGRSDATMNKFGVRMGSVEIYEAVEQLDEIREALVVGVEQKDGGYWMPLFVTLRDPHSDTSGLEDRMKKVIRTSVSPRHVPDEVIVVDALPHTLTGKRLEVPIKRILQGIDPAHAANLNSVDNADALLWFAALAERVS